MITDKYIVLRTPAPADLSDPFARGAAFSPAGPRGAVPSIEMESLSKRDLVDMKRDPQVQAIAPSMPVRLIAPKAEEAAQAPGTAGVAWGITATKASDSPFTGKGIIVAVLDTGIDATHPAFRGIDLVQQDFTGEGDQDDVGHGTHVAGTIFGQDAGDFRFGIARGVQRALIGKVLGVQGGSTDQIYRGILWALDNGANIISMSLGMDFPGYVDALIAQGGLPADLATSVALEGYRANVRLFDRLAELIAAHARLSQGTMVTAAAGNESKRDINPDYEIIVAPPAAADGIVAVGALEQSGKGKKLRVADFSNTGPNVSAPGVGVFSAWPGGGYRSLSGTSMATPHVAGIAALWAEKLSAAAGRLDSRELIARLIGTAQTTALSKGFDPLDVGAGLVQAPLR